jgi:hypothetical protein
MCGGVEIYLQHSSSRHYMDVSGQLYAPVVLFHGNSPEIERGCTARHYIDWAITSSLEDSDLDQVENWRKQVAVIKPASVQEIVWRKRITLGLKWTLCRKHGGEQDAYREICLLFVANCSQLLSNKERQEKWTRPIYCWHKENGKESA